jgi:hypothetical protein
VTPCALRRATSPSRKSSHRICPFESGAGAAKFAQFMVSVELMRQCGAK